MHTESVPQLAAKKALPVEISHRFQQFKSKCDGLAQSQVETANEARQIGMLVQEWCGHEQMTMGFFENHKSELGKGITFGMLKTFVAISNRMKEPAATLQDARRVLQMDMIAAGLLELPTRTVQQTATAKTPYVEVVNRIGGVRIALTAWLRDTPLDQWDRPTRDAVKSQLDPLVEFYNRL